MSALGRLLKKSSLQQILLNRKDMHAGRDLFFTAGWVAG